MKVKRIGLDLAKNIFQIHGVDIDEQTIVRQRLKRVAVLSYFARLDRVNGCVVGMESCCGSDYWARELRKLGYEVRIMNPKFVKPYVKSAKNDARDAEAICEAVGRPTMRFIPVKTLEQQDLMLLHRQREQQIRRRTALANQTRGLLMNYGIILSPRLSNLRHHLLSVLDENTDKLTELAREVFIELHEELVWLDEKIAKLDTRLNALAKTRDDCRRLMTIPGVGCMSATAFVAWMGDGNQFSHARECPAYLGLVPDQHSSGDKARLGHISKRGNRYLRTLLIIGAHADLNAAQRRRDNELGSARDQWSTALEERRHSNVAAVALANKNARIAWALLRDKTEYRCAA